MFEHCDSLKKLDLSNFIITDATVEDMLSYCRNLVQLDLSNIDLSRARNCDRMLKGYNCDIDIKASESVLKSIEYTRKL